MPAVDRRAFLLSASAALALPPAVANALAIDADVRTATLKDVEHVVILMQENRAFDHYFGVMNGVRGFGDRFPIPRPDSPGVRQKTVWTQVNDTGKGGPPLVSPFPLDTVATFAHMRVEGTPHGWSDAQAAWNEGRMNRWPAAKTERAMGYYRREDIPFQYAMADAFTICDAYHCSTQTGTNTNRLFLWTGTNDPSGRHGGPSISNSHDSLVADGGAADPYRWTTYGERLLAAGVTWRIYQDMADNFTDNPTAGFKAYRDSHAALPGSDPRLAALALSTRKLDGLREDVLAGALPQVSYIVAPAADSEHPGPSSPAQGADYTARVIDALTADPKVWARTVLLVMFDENDGFFDHVPPPAPPCKAADGTVLGASTVDTAGEYHLVRNPTEASAERDELMGRPYGLGPRVPLYVLSPWSRGGWVNSQVFDHTSVIRFLEARFGVTEPNISPWRRAVCGDLTSAFDFKTPNDTPFGRTLPTTQALAGRAAALKATTVPPTPAEPTVPMQATGTRPSRGLPYELRVDEGGQDGRLTLTFGNDGSQAAVFHVYDRLRLDLPPRRYTVEPGKQARDAWPSGAYDLWVLGPNGFHRHFIGGAPGEDPILSVVTSPTAGLISLTLRNPGGAARTLAARPNAYERAFRPWKMTLPPAGDGRKDLRVTATGGWYDVSIEAGGYLRRLAGRLEMGVDTISDPAMGGMAVMDQPYRG
ncbi:MAG: phospholipase C, phosphocholine-specific [Phenylobacterium sp.]|uniref:phosphocholine-specific phospholipase C n=1 Tax=Phenylobacterium sp. TaxID=1871053 RepID=UPI0011F4A4C6|nr:phospholipase C, phosphocholine-specific [Phenylobacterium sp.]TAJ70206.1 MAG: phospholipase C, phosphocholine-specific [Phenylobacterium sp.]